MMLLLLCMRLDHKVVVEAGLEPGSTLGEGTSLGHLRIIDVHLLVRIVLTKLLVEGDQARVLCRGISGSIDSPRVSSILLEFG